VYRSARLALSPFDEVVAEWVWGRREVEGKDFAEGEVIAL